MRCKWTIMVLTFFAVTAPCHAAGNYSTSFIEAFKNTFAAKSQTGSIEMNSRALRRIYSLMVREGLPTTGEEARQRGDVELLRMGMLAAVGGISPWERHDKSSGMVMLEDDGSMIAKHSLKSMESHLMICVITVLLGAIGCMHMMAARPA